MAFPLRCAVGRAVLLLAAAALLLGAPGAHAQVRGYIDYTRVNTTADPSARDAGKFAGAQRAGQRQLRPAACTPPCAHPDARLVS